MSAGELRRLDGTAYREAVPERDRGAPPVLLLHGFPETSLMWEPLLDRLGAGGRRAIAPDLYGLGDSEDAGPETWERNVERFGALVAGLGLERLTLVVHDWGGFVGLAWACENPESVAGLVISSTGFFSDGCWHGMAEAIRGERGEAIVAGLDRSGFGGMLGSLSRGFDDTTLDAYWRSFEHGRGHEATLEFYRSMDFEKLAPYEGRLAELGVPTLILWGSGDEFAPVSGARRFEREIPGSELVVLERVGHFVYDDEPEGCAAELTAFLDRSGL